MNLFIKIKKIISVVLLVCVISGFIPTQIFAQGAPDMSGYAGWDPSKMTVSGVYSEGGKTKSLGTVAVGEQGKVTNLTSQEQFQLLQKIPTEKYRQFTDNDFTSEGNFYKISTNDGKVSYYYRGDKSNDASDDILMGHAEGNEFIIPNQKIIKASGQNDPNSKDINTEQGLKNALDEQKGREPNTTYNTLVTVDKLQNDRAKLEQDQASYDAEVERLKKLLEADDKALAEDASEFMQPDERIKTEEALKEAEKRAADGRRNMARGVEASEANTLSLAECETFSLKNNSCIVIMSAIVANIALKLSAFVLYWTGNLFDYSIEIAVNSAEFLDTLGIIEPTWAFVRDALNMTFIFILLFVSIQILLGKAGYTAKNSIARLVLVAILINFSLFAAKAMVDASNIISLNIYEGIKSRDEKTPAGNRGNVSARIMTTLGLSGVYAFGDAFDGKTIEGCGTAPDTILTVGIFGTILLVITSLTFLLAAILFFLRMLNIIVLFISSPFAVWGQVMQGGYFKGTYNWWWSNMLHVLKFPVVYMLMLYVTLAMFAQLNSVTSGASTNGIRVSFIRLICDTSTKTGSTGLAEKLPLILNFIIVIAALMGIIMYAAKNSGKAGVLGTSKLATNISNKIDNIQKKFTTGAAQGVYNKSRDAVVGVGAGTIAMGGKARDATLTLAKDVVRKGADAVGTLASDKLGRMATGEGKMGSMFAKSPKLQTALAIASTKLKDQKIFGETEKEALKRRTAPAVARAQILADVQAEALKVDDHKAWVKKNPKGDLVQYEDYLKNKVRLIEKTQLGGLENKKVKDDKGKEITTQEMVREGNIIEDITEDIVDANGVVTGKKVIGKKLNQERLYNNIEKATKQHKESGALLENEKSKRFGILKEERAEARLKVKKENLSKLKSAAKKKQQGKKSIDDKKMRVKKAKEQLERLPVNLDTVDRSKRNDYSSDVTSYITQIEKIENDMTRQINGLGSSATADNETRIRERAESEVKKIRTLTEEKVSKERDRLDTIIEKAIKDIDAHEEAEEKKDEKK